jgi:predicted P-loop ATPase
MPSLLEQLEELPDSWGLVAVGGNKDAYQDDWQSNPLTKAQAAVEIKAGRAKAIGVIAGPTSGGLLFLDHDGLSATTQLEALGLHLRTLPESLTVTSGRDGRFQIIYSIPETFWPALRNRRFWYTGPKGPNGKETKILGTDGKAEQVDLRWNSHYSVVIGAHPETTGYRWMRGRGPSQQPIAEAPPELIELLLKDQPSPITQRSLTIPPPIPGGTLPLLEFITRDSRTLIESGGTPGSWNDDQLRLALDLRGTESWILAQGHRPDISAEDAFAQHITAARSKSPDFNDRKAWTRFHGADAHHPLPGASDEQLRSRLAFHTRPQRQRKQPPPGPHSTQETPAPPIHAKPQRLEASELLQMLELQAANGSIRWNTFTQSLELNGESLTGAERFYLHLAQQGFKVSKELALDCLIQVARAHEYDPVTEYLDHVAATVEPTFIDALATGYLRPDDASEGQPTLYDHMLRCTLIGAVRRAFEPGCKHDTACIIMGDQGARKSSFWSALGGPFFSDALGDIGSKDDLMVLHRSWLMEWGEIDRITSRKEAAEVKSFLSQAVDLFRVPYGKLTESFPRRGIIVGSTNRSTGFLQDETGNRRFWVIPTTRTESDPIDTGTLAAERDAIWAAAVHAYRAGDPSHLPAELSRQVASENEAYLVTNPWEPAILTWLSTPKPDDITTERILTEAIQKPIERQKRSDQMAVADILRKFGYDRRKRRINGIPTWIYSKA